jgi:ABC-type glycerol-3-phosphate transport system substrate-binding protein
MKIIKAFTAAVFIQLLLSFSLSAKENTVLTVWNMPTEADVLYRQVWDENMDSFEADNPGVKIRGISREYKPQEFVSVMASGKGPDVVTIPITAVPVMAKYGFLSKMNEYTDKWMQKDYMPKIMWDSVNINGSIYAIPDDSYFTTLFYRKDIFDKCGLTQPPKNWQDIINYSKIINDKLKDTWGIALQPDMFYFIDFIWQAGGAVYSNEKLNLNDQSVITALKFWHDLKWKYNAMPPQNIFYDYDVEQLFSTGKIAMMLGVAKNLPVMARRYGLDLKTVEIVPLPAGNTGVQAWHAGGEAFIINKAISQEKKDLAWAYITHVMSPPRQLWKFMRMKQLNMVVFPGDFSCATNLINMPEFANVKGLIEYANVEPPLYRWPMIKEDFNKMVLEKIFINRDVDFDATLLEFDKRMKDEYNE